MSRYNVIKTATDAYIKRNGRREITGPILNSVLNAIIDSLGKFYQFVGVATPSTNPGSPDQNVAYVAATAGTYANMGGVVLASGEMAVIKWDGTWVKETILILPEGSESYFIRGTIDFNQDPPAVTITSGTYAEALAAYNDGSPVYAALTEGNGAVNIYPLAQVISPFIVFLGIGADSVLAVVLESDGTVTAVNSALVHPSDLAPVATSGDYNDLDNLPTIPAPQVQSDWDEADVDDPSFIKNKPTIPAAQVQSDWNEADNTDPAYIKNKPTIPIVPDISTDIVTDRASDTKTASPKAVFDASAKYGVISQTQTWTQAADGGYDYAMSNPVMGLIPQANIDLFESAGAVFNASTGYFELNGLTDISYEEMQDIYNVSLPMLERINLQGAFYGKNIRTNINIYKTGQEGPYGSIAMTDLDFRAMCYSSGIEVFALMTSEDTSLSQTRYHITNNLSFAFATQAPTYIQKIKKIIGVISIKNSSTSLYKAFYRCFSLEHVIIYGLNASIDFSQSPRLNVESIVAMISNAGTATLTITLHATAYARATADPAVQAALAAHTNVTLASA